MPSSRYRHLKKTKMFRCPCRFRRPFCIACSLFIIGTVICSFFQPDLTFPNQLLNESLPINESLKQMSTTCTPDDRPRQLALLSVFQAWVSFAQKYQIQYWIAYETLVGYVQRRGILPHVRRIDVIILAQDTSQLVDLSQSNMSSNYELTVNPQWSIIEGSNGTYFSSDGINFIAPNARFRDRKTNYHVNIFPSYYFNSSNSTVEEESVNITIYDPWYKWLSYPENWTYPLQICYFSDIKTLCPAEPEKLVVTMYGWDALNTSDTKCVNGAWVDTD